MTAPRQSVAVRATQDDVFEFARLPTSRREIEGTGGIGSAGALSALRYA